MTVLVSDSFNRANNGSVLGSTDSYNGGTSKTWLIDSGTLGISNNQAYTSAIGTNGSIAQVDVGISDFSISSDVIWQTNSANVGFVARYTDAFNHLLVRVNASSIGLFKMVSGVSTQIGSYSITPVAGTSYAIKVTFYGSSITVFLNGNSIITGTDTFNQTATKAGLRFSQNDIYSRLDNFIIEDLNTGGGTGTTYSGAGTASGISSLTSPEKVIAKATGTAQGATSLSLADKTILGASGTAQGSSNLSSDESVIYGASGVSQGTTILSPGEHLILPASGTSTGQSSLTSNDTVVEHGTTTYSGSGQSQGSSSLSSAETMSYSAKGTAQGLSDLLAGEVIILLASGISEGYSTLTFIDKSNQIIGTIHLKGSAILNVYLVGSQTLNVNLKGGI